MIDVRLIVAVVEELGNITLDDAAARAIASDMQGLNALMKLARQRLGFGHSPHDFAQLLTLE